MHDIRKYMDLLKEDDDNVIQFPKQPNKLEKLAKEIPNIFAYQDYVEKLVRKRVKDIQHSSKSYSAKYKNPTIMAEYQKNIDPMKAWAFQLYWAKDPYYLKDPKIAFAAREAHKYLNDFIEICKEQKDRLRELYKMPELKKMPAPQYATSVINMAITEYDHDLDMFEEFRKDDGEET